MSNHKCDFCGNNKFLSKKSLVTGIGNHRYVKETQEFIICSNCENKLEDAKIQVEINFTNKVKSK